VWASAHTLIFKEKINEYISSRCKSTTVAEFTVRATTNTNGDGLTEYIQFPGTGIRCATSIKLTIGTAVTFCTVIFG